MSSGTASRVRGLRITRLEPAAASGWLVNFAAADRETFFSALEIVRALPEHQRRWIADDRTWWISAAALLDLCEQLPDLAAALAAWRRDAHSSAGQRTRYGPRAEADAEPEAEEKRPRRRRSATTCVPAGIAATYKGVPAATSEAFATLHLLPTAWPELVKAAHRIAAKRYHPDHAGGEHRKMVTANLAAEQAGLWAEQHEEPSQAGVA